MGPERLNLEYMNIKQSPIYTNSVVTPNNERALSSGGLQSFALHPQPFSSSSAVQNPISIDIQEETNSHFLLTYALHYEVKLMRKAWNVLMQTRYDNMKEKLCNHLSQFHRAKRLKLNAFKGLHEHLILHYGHKFAKE